MDLLCGVPFCRLFSHFSPPDLVFKISLTTILILRNVTGQVNHFNKFAKEKIPYAIERFKNETLRVYGVLEIQLSGKYTGQERDYLAGNGRGKYSVADIGTWPWVKGYAFSGFSKDEDMKPFPHLLKWIDRIASRPAVQRGVGEKYNEKK